MNEILEIKGGATEFEAAVVAIVIDHVEREERASLQRRGEATNALPAWVAAVRPEMGLEGWSLPR